MQDSLYMGTSLKESRTYPKYFYLTNGKKEIYITPIGAGELNRILLDTLRDMAVKRKTPRRHSGELQLDVEVVKEKNKLEAKLTGSYHPGDENGEVSLYLRKRDVIFVLGQLYLRELKEIRRIHAGMYLKGRKPSEETC